MKQYIWFHPLYISGTAKATVEGQMRNAEKHGYIVLKEKELNKVSARDHLSIVGHSFPPKSEVEADIDATLLQVRPPEEMEAELAEDIGQREDTGFYIQGETAEQCIKRLQKAGLKKGPQILSLECCIAAAANGIAEQLSSHRFFINTIIEANTSGIGRNPGNLSWSMAEDCFGRVVLQDSKNPWIFLLGGTQVAKRSHGTYQISEVIKTILQQDFHSRFFSYYRPGLRGGRVGRYCENTGQRITREKAVALAVEQPGSATDIALQEMDKEEGNKVLYR
ncbi:TPA: hypothetical protein ACPSKB_000486 [Legionella feeleii]|uniref:Uncharacterized protein n=1 Tax=Legionella feeleii TaxID=453 RepID=A0A378ITT1_9GAMM|nr:hypothetical protein [Legionella feeleii]STX38549.1 Uncharacterised protein [Legionella feeleii]